jgi:Rrf2 family protein
MRISTRARYGLRFMVELAANSGKGPLYLKDIAHSQEISEKYLGQIAIDLKAAHLIDGFRGVHGGYVLAKNPSEITVYDVVRILEDGLTLVDYTKNQSLCSRAGRCITQEVWNELGEVIAKTLEAITLADLLERQREKSREFVMYYI